MKTAILKLIKKANLDHEHCISLIGGGGKTTLVFELGDVFCKDEKTILTTTTHMLYPDHLDKQQICLHEDILEIKQKLKSLNLLFLAKPYINNKMQAMSLEFLSNVLLQCDKMIIEADGSKHYPLKFEKETEPVVPSFCNCVIQVVGASAINKKASEVLHRYLLAKKYFNWQDNPIVDLLILKQIIIYNFNKVAAKRKIVVINQIDVLKDFSLLYSLKNQLPYEIYFLSVKKDLFY